MSFLKDNPKSVECLVMKAKAGDKESMIKIVNQYRPLLADAINRLKLPKDETKDLWQEATLVVLLAVRNYQPMMEGSFGAYIKKTVNTFFLARRQKRRRKSIEATVALESLPEHGSDFIAEELQEDTATEDALLFAAIDRLPDSRRRVLLDYYIRGKKQRDIAAAEGIGETAVAQRIHYAIRALRKELMAADEEKDEKNKKSLRKA